MSENKMQKTNKIGLSPMTNSAKTYGFTNFELYNSINTGLNQIKEGRTISEEAMAIKLG